MIKYFCDMCKGEIGEDNYVLQLGYKRKAAEKVVSFQESTLCEDCQTKIQALIANFEEITQ